MIALFVCMALALIAGACQENKNPMNYADNFSARANNENAALSPAASAPDPSGQVTISAGSKSLTFWPFTSNNFEGEPQDPINLIFFGKCDPRQIRAALMGLDGDRSALGFPAVAPFNSRWDDAIGDVQTSYGDGGWTGGVIQLACGDYMSVRFHLRLFTMGEWTVGNVHFEALIPGTADHQVLNWEVAEQFVVGDFFRSGLLDATTPVIQTEQINPSPFRTIPAIIYNGLPHELQGLIGGPIGQVQNDVPIGTDGHAMILNLAHAVPVVPETKVQEFVVFYDQVIPKPFCNDGDDYLYAQGPVTLEQVVTITHDLNYELSFKAEGTLTLTPVNPLDGQPLGPSLRAKVMEKHRGRFTTRNWTVGSSKLQKITPANAPGAGSLKSDLEINSNGKNDYSIFIRCADEAIAGK